ncbi:MAG: phosphate regulon sensor protein PhoR, partial [Burkholderiaceae bacterium]
MYGRWRHRIHILGPTIVRLAGLAAFAAVIGLAFGARAGLWVAVIGLGALLIIHLRYASLLAAWLDNPKLDEVPDG